jgi:hypothetical protein
LVTPKAPFINVFDEGVTVMGKMIIFVGLASAVTLGALFLAGMLNGMAG